MKSQTQLVVSSGIIALSMFAASFSPSSLAQARATDEALVNPTMETMTIIYRNAFDYALYQHTAEMLAAHHQQLHSNIMLDARQQSKTMAKNFAISIADSNALPQNRNSLQEIGVLVAPQ
ncbi:hypothetical protein G3R49_03175 [Shewanella sp. WXL01]|uniref:hypothetical protein n=1 Tax=Shewanella sp. WXL01 TaxID=2709721 RepID=UPI00143849F2|nr:hypothetical protein [Shewanella sp. WXL01]NKF49584.1 hypothetical protein [Shewanella sp. WXL01]